MYMKQVWRTNQSFEPVTATSTEQFMAFHGLYRVVVKNDEIVLKEKIFYVGKGANVKVNLSC